MFDGRWRAGVERGMRPVGVTLRGYGITADHLTATGLVLAATTALAIGTGHLKIGLVLWVASALPDLLDGAVAKASGTASTRGAFFDSVIDRVTDSLLLGGLGWYLASTQGAHWAMLPFALLAVSNLVSYQRAKAESLGLDARGGLMERAERLAALWIGLLFSSLLLVVLWVTLVLTLATAVQRFAKVWHQAAGPSRPLRERSEHRERHDFRMARGWEGWQVRRGSRRGSQRSGAARPPRSWSRQTRTRP